VSTYVSRVVAGARTGRRAATASVEFALCAPLLFLLLLGLWEVGRITEVSNVMWNSAREASRDASLGQTNLQGVANNLLVYLQGAEPTAFAQGHSTQMMAPVITLPPNTYGYTCWDTTANRELFTVTFTDVTDPTVTDPTLMSQLHICAINVQAPYSGVGWLPVASITGMNRLSVTVDWVSMVDSPFQIAPSLPAQ
jgi:Flp pilus assembly protein TadG